jgi:hypothetical protein
VFLASVAQQASFEVGEMAGAEMSMGKAGLWMDGVFLYRQPHARPIMR